MLGSLLVHARVGETPLCGIIVETEAYPEDDPASHSFRGQTKRNASMFLRAGHSYVYQIYGIHYCFNISAEEAGCGSAVLIRSLGSLPAMDGYRDGSCTGPGRLCKRMGITSLESDALAINTASDEGFFLYVPRSQQCKEIHRRRSTRRIGLNKSKHLFRRYCLSLSEAISGIPNGKETCSIMRV